MADADHDVAIVDLDGLLDVAIRPLLEAHLDPRHVPLVGDGERPGRRDVERHLLPVRLLDLAYHQANQLRLAPATTGEGIVGALAVAHRQRCGTRAGADLCTTGIAECDSMT